MAITRKSKVEVENINVPGYVTRVDAIKYNDMKQAMLRTLPRRSPGMTAEQIKQGVKPHLGDATFPNGEKVGWWAKTVQLDLEAKGELVREKTRPLRWYRT